MTVESQAHEQRGMRAADAIARLPHGGRESVRLQVHCANSHHLAKVFDTEDGLAYQSTVHPHAHGDRDRPDDLHRAEEPRHWSDLLDGDPADDALPAWCDCGHRLLSRAAVQRWIADGERRVVVE